MEFAERNFWLDGVPKRNSECVAPPEHVDVVVIGAGFTGLSAARSLARGGASVAVLEAETVGFGASSRNAGMLLPGLKVRTSLLVQRYGKELAKRIYQASMDAINWVESTVTEEQIACEFRRNGHLFLAAKPAHFESIVRSSELLQLDFDHPVKVIAREQLSEEIGSNAYYGGMLDSCSGGVNPARYVLGLAQAAEKAGAKVFEKCALRELTRVSRNGTSGWKALTNEGKTVFAEKVMLATGAYTPRSLPIIPRKIVPIGSFIIVTDVLAPEVARNVIPNGRMVYDSLNYLHYFRLTPDRRMLFGGRAAFFPATAGTVQSSAAILRREMVRVLPQLECARVEYVWGGTLDVTFDLMPHSGGSEGLFFAIGFAGHGVALASYLGSRLGANMLRQEWDDPFASIRFPGAPLGMYDGRPWFLPAVGAWLKLRDWLS